MPARVFFRRTHASESPTWLRNLSEPGASERMEYTVCRLPQGPRGFKPSNFGFVNPGLRVNLCE